MGIEANQIESGSGKKVLQARFRQAKVAGSARVCQRYQVRDDS